MRAIQITEFGGPEVLTPVELPDPEPHDGLEVLDVLAAGVNYADTHQTDDSYLSRQRLPLVPGLTAWHLLRTSARLQPGESVLVHAAAGGVGTLAVQLAKLYGAGRVIALASTPDKRALAAELGADATVDPA